MLFNSAIFLFAFLPCTLILYFLIGRLGTPRPALCFLVLASLVFYSWWSLNFLVVLLGSILINAAFGYLLIEPQYSFTKRRIILVVGILLNLSILGYFKYAYFIAANLNQVFDTHLSVASIALPLGISFFTFQKIAYLVDAYRGLIHKFRLLEYGLFVTFFPQLIAGPIVHHAEMIPQFMKTSITKANASNLALGTSIFCIGLFMKTVLADVSASFADPIFQAADAGKRPVPAEAWVGALAYSFQLYFDFAGYSAMAIGLARMFNIVLPLNFFSPYKAVNIIDFWRRWHITLSRFLRDYLYFPLGGNRRGTTRRYFNLLVTMVLGGLWHGAAWTFVLWGALHGLYLVVNHAWHALLQKIGVNPDNDSTIGRGVARVLTFIAVVTAWVPFRSMSFDGMRRMLQAMYGVSGGSVLDSVRGYLAAEFERVGTGDVTSSVAWLTCVAIIAFATPNIYELFRRFDPALLEPSTQRHFRSGRGNFEWRMSRPWAVLTAVLLLVSLTQFGRLSPFLYFQF